MPLSPAAPPGRHGTEGVWQLLSRLSDIFGRKSGRFGLGRVWLNAILGKWKLVLTFFYLPPPCKSTSLQSLDPWSALEIWFGFGWWCALGFQNHLNGQHWAQDGSPLTGLVKYPMVLVHSILPGIFLQTTNEDNTSIPEVKVVQIYLSMLKGQEKKTRISRWKQNILYPHQRYQATTRTLSVMRTMQTLRRPLGKSQLTWEVPPLSGLLGLVWGGCYLLVELWVGKEAPILHAGLWSPPAYNVVL